MNWLDILIMIQVLSGAYFGWKSGFIKSVFLVIGVVLAALIGAQFSEPIGGWASKSVENDATATVIAYVVAGAIVFVVVQMVGAIIHKTLKMLFLGILHKAAGAGLGALTGIISAGFLIALLARLAVLVPDTTPIGGQEATKVREGLTNSLVDSAFVPVYLDVEENFPANALGMLPGDFAKAFDELRQIRESR